MSEQFARLQAALESGGADAALEQLIAQIQVDHRPHDLFNARLMQARRRLGLPLLATDALDEVAEPARAQLEAAYLDACREVGGQLLADGAFREAWMYLRLVGDKEGLAAELEKITPDEENIDELVELALHEGVAPAHGFRLVLDHYGTCNAITTFEATMPHQPLAAQQHSVGMLVRHLHQELTENVRSHIQDRPDANLADGASLAEMAAGHPWIFEGESYHIDTSHLASTVRFARLLEDPTEIDLAWQLTEYGRRLAPQFQYDGEEPFTDLYPAHGLLFAASLGREVDEAVAHFRQRAEEVSAEDEGTAAIETYLILLARLDRHADALEAYGQLVPPGSQLSPYAPTMLDLAEQGGAIDRYLQLCQQRNDLLAYTAGLVSEKR